MNFQLESIINALNYSYQGTTEQISLAQQYLSNMISYPNEYSSMLVNIMTAENIPEMTRIAASIQFKYLFSNSEIANLLSIQNIIEIINKTPPLVQIQLQSILSRIVDKCLSHDPEQGIQMLLSIITACFNSDIKQIFVGIEIIRFIFKSNARNVFPIPGIGNKETLASKYVIPLFNILCNLGISTPEPFLLHYMLLTAHYLLNYSDLHPLNNWINLIITILNQEIDFSSNHSNIDKDAVKFATGIIESKRDFLEPQMASMIFNSIVNRIKRNQMSYKGILYSLRYINQFLQFDTFISDLQNSNNSNILLEFVKEILFNFFVLNPNAIQQINEDLFNFLLFRHNNTYQIIESPISGAINVLKKICEQKYFINEIANFSLSELKQSIEKYDYGRLYGSTHFASIIAPHLDPSFTDIIIQTLSASIQKNPENPENQNFIIFTITSFFLFLSNVKINNLDLFIFSLNSLTNEALPNIVHYFCAISIPNFISFFKIEEIIDKIQSTINFPLFIKKIVELNSKYPTNQIFNSIKTIFRYFLPFLEPVSIEVVQELFSIYYQLVNEENYNKFKICSSIIRLSNMMKNKGNSIEFYTVALQVNLKLLSEIEPTNYEDLLNVMYNLIHDFANRPNIYSNTTISDLLIQIPDFLLSLIADSPDLTIYPFITDILKALSIHLMNSNFNSISLISQPISKILQIFLGKFVNNENYDPNDMPLLTQSINKLSQTLFIILKEQEALPQFLEAFTKINEINFADSFAAIATLSPIPTFSNDINFRICLYHASPAAFLLCFQFVVSNMNQMPDFILSEQNNIKKNIEQNIGKLINEMKQMEQKNNKIKFNDDDGSDDEEIVLFEDDNDNFDDFDNGYIDSVALEDSDIFDFQSLLAFYQS